MAMPNPGAPAGFRLGIDLGTSRTTAVMQWPDGRLQELLFDSYPYLPSAVCTGSDGGLQVGRAAIDAGTLHPERFEPAPARRVGQATMRLGESTIETTAVLAALLDRVRVEATMASGGAEPSVALAHPAGWTASQRQALSDACRRAGLADPALIPAPVAATCIYATVLGRAVPAGSGLAVVHFGAGTYEASVVAPTAGGYEIRATARLDDLGGADLDAALLNHLGGRYRARDPQAWQRLEHPRSPADRRHRRHLLEDVRAAKEMLSRADSATVPIPVLEVEARIGRTEFETLARPYLDRAVATAAAPIRGSGLFGGAPDTAASEKRMPLQAPAGQIGAALLVGGASRIPLLAALLREGTGLEIVTVDRPETAAAEGCARLAHRLAAQSLPAVPRVPPPRAVPAPAPVPLPMTLEPQRGREYRGTATGRSARRWLAAAAAGVLLAGLAAAAILLAPDLLPPRVPGVTGPGPDQSPPNYQRGNPPVWLPAGFDEVVDDEVQAAVDLARAPANGGTCRYEAPGVLRIQRDRFDVTGCFTTEAVRRIQVGDAAVEAELRLGSGCAVMWLRVTNQGYAVMVCHSGAVELHRLVDEPASPSTRLAIWQPRFDPAKVVVGLLARGDQLAVYVNGVAQATVQDRAPIAQGRVGLGAFQPGGVAQTDVTIIRFRAWARPEASG
jgi:hypothetical protein